MKNIFFKNKLFLFLLQLSTQFFGIMCISNGANEPIADNELGLTSKDCSMQFCVEKDSLGLWLSLQNTCSQNANPYFLEINSQETIIQETNYTSLLYANKGYYALAHNNNVSPIVSASLCALSSICSLMLGYVIAHHYHKKIVYTQVKEEDDF